MQSTVHSWGGTHTTKYIQRTIYVRVSLVCKFDSENKSKLNNNQRLDHGLKFLLESRCDDEHERLKTEDKNKAEKNNLFEF